MNAIEFVKKFGWEEASEVVAGIPEKFQCNPLGLVCYDNNTYKYSDRFKPRRSLVNMADLKRLVESHELVEKHGGVVDANAMSWKLSKMNLDTQAEQLKKAINLVEQCQ